MKDRQREREKERKREGKRTRRVVRVAAALECVRTNYTLDRALQVLLLPLMEVGGRGKREGHATRDCLLLLPSGSADHSNQTISRFSLQQYLRCKRDKQQDLMLLLCFAFEKWRGKERKGQGIAKRFVERYMSILSYSSYTSIV